MKEREKSGKIKFIMTATMLELHLMCLSDVLNNKIPLYYDVNNQEVFGAEEWFLNSEEDIIKYGAMSDTRATRGTLMNDTSSRSHCYSRVYLTVLDVETKKIRKSCFQMVDLAGSERVKKAHGDVNPRKVMGALEGLCVNLNLSGLIFLMEKIGSSKRKNKLKCLTDNERKGAGGVFPCMHFTTGLLDGIFSGNSVTSMIVNVSQAARNTFESGYALKFGESCSRVPMYPKKNKFESPSVLKKSYLRKLRENEKAIKAGIRNPKFVNYRNLKIKTFNIELKKIKTLLNKKV